MQNKPDRLNLVLSPKGSKNLQEKSLPILQKNKLSFDRSAKSATPEITQLKNPILFASHSSFPKYMAPLSSQRVSRLDNPTSPQASRPDKNRQSIYSFGATPDFNSTFRSGFFQLAETESQSNQKQITDQEELTKLKNKLQSITRKRNDLKNINVFDEKQQANISKLMFYLNEFYSNILNDEHGISPKDHKNCNLMLEIESFFCSMIAELMIHINAISNEKNGQKHVIVRLEQEIKNMDLKFQERTQKEFVEMSQLRETLKQKILENSKEGNIFNVQIKKIEYEKELMEKKLENILTNQDVDVLKKEIDKLRTGSKKIIDQLESELKYCQGLVDTYELKYSGLKGMVEKLTQINRENEFKINELTSKTEKNEKMISEFKAKSNMYRERALMQLADYEGLKLELQAFQENFARFREKYLQDKAKLDKLMEEKQKMHEMSGLENILKDITIYNSLQEIFSTKLSNGRALQWKKMKENVTFGQIDLKHYMIAIPTFQYLFIGKKLYEQIEEPKFKLDFVATIRAIFDSKYNEFLYVNDTKQISRFPDFVYAWTGKFVLCPYQRRIRMSDIKDPDPEVFRNEIIRLLNNQMAQKIWDCIIFKEFLDEVHSRDELTYFLQCRNLVFRGPQLNDASATFCYTYYIKLDWAGEVLDHLIGDKYDKETTTMIKQKLSEKAKIKNNKALIDSAFFLRVLLEEYKKEKKEKFLILKNIISSEPNSHQYAGRFSISFESFKNILITYFPETADLEKAELYRKCWTIGNGIVDSESILTVLNDENYFSKLMKFRNYVKLPVLTKNYEFEETKENTVYKLIGERYGKMNQSIEAIKNAAFSLGVEKLVVELFEYDKFIRNKFQPDINELNGKSFYLWISSLLLHAERLNYVYLSTSKEYSQKKEVALLKNLFSSFEKSFNELITEQNKEVLKEFELNVRIKKVQKFIKSKLSTWYKLMSFILRNKIEKINDKNGRTYFKTKKT